MVYRYQLKLGEEENLQDLTLYLSNRIVDKWHVPNGELIVKAAAKQSEGVFFWVAFLQGEMTKLAKGNRLNEITDYPDLHQIDLIAVLFAVRVMVTKRKTE
jgi:hypothetical protein